MADVVKRQSIMSIRHLRPRLKYSAEVAKINPAISALKDDKPALRTRMKTRATPETAAKADGILAVYEFSPNKLKIAERAQKYSGGFSRKGSLLSLGTTGSPDISISAAIPATLSSSGPNKGLCPRPTKKRRAAYTTRKRKYVLVLRLSSKLIKRALPFSACPLTPKRTQLR